MKKLILYILVLSVALSLGSCRMAAEKARENIRVEAVERLVPQGLTGFELVLRVKNDTGYKLALKKAELDVSFAGSVVGTIRLREGVEVGRRTTGSVETQWQMRVADPLALYVLTRKIKQGDLSQIAVSYDVEGRGGPAKVKISRQMIPLSEFLSTFDLTLKDLEKYLK